jgi:hypothetical protein
VAGEFTPAPNLGNTVLDLDAPTGKYSAWKISDLKSINAMRSTLKVRRLVEGPKWLPTFTIILANADESLTLEISTPARQPPLEIHLVHRKGEQIVENLPFSSLIEIDQKLDVAIDWTEAGTITVRLGSRETLMSTFRSPPTSIQFSASTGEVEFNPLKLGHTSS